MNAPPQVPASLASWTTKAIDQECRAAYRQYEKARRQQYLDYFAQHPELPKRKLEVTKDGSLSRLLDPVLSVFVHSLGAFVEHDGKLYEGGDFDDGFKLALKLSDSVEVNELRLALETQQHTETTETEDK